MPIPHMPWRPAHLTARRARAVLVMAAFGGLGVLLLSNSHAATVAASSEAEIGAYAGNAAVMNDPNASGGGAVRFGGESSFADNFATYPQNSCYPDGSAFGSWKVVYTGYGCVKAVTDSGSSWLSQAPQVSTASTETHACLTTGPAASGSFTYRLRMKTIAQLRTGSAANTWEAGWALWDYSDDTHFYYLTLKPNGWELGKEDPAYPGAQRFLATGGSPSFAIGSTNDVEITQDSSHKLTVTVNGTVLTSFTDTERPYSSGNIGLYTEDAQVLYTNVSLASEAAAGGTSFTPAGMRVLPDPLYGVTLDNDSVIGQAKLNDQVAALQHLPHMPTSRIVFDAGTAATDYSSAIDALQPVSYLMGEIADSTDLAKASLQQYHDLTAKWLQAFGSKVDLWEIGNEVNGNWTGPYADVAAKIADAYSQVKAAGKRSELTLWYNPGCAGSSSELDPILFSNTYVPADVRNGLDYVSVSYYETQCNNYRPGAAELSTLFTQLHALYPNARLGFGEVGLPAYVTSATQASAQSIAAYYYGLHITLPYYVGGYFWWGFAEDGVPYDTQPLWQTINTGMAGY